MEKEFDFLEVNLSWKLDCNLLRIETETLTSPADFGFVCNYA